MEGTLKDDLQRLIQKIIASRRVISDVTRLFHDLGIAGDDAAELLNNVKQSFGTKFDGFRFETYFPNETETLIYHFARLFGYHSRKKPFTFGHLVQVVKTGHWFEPTQ